MAEWCHNEEKPAFPSQVLAWYNMLKMDFKMNRNSVEKAGSRHSAQSVGAIGIAYISHTIPKAEEPSSKAVLIH